MASTDKNPTEPTLDQRVTNLREMVQRQTNAYNEAQADLTRLDAEREQLAAAGDHKGLDANTQAKRQARTALEEAERDLSDAQTWLSAAQQQQADEERARQAAEAEAAVEPAMEAFREALQAAIDRVESATATLLRLASEIREDFDALARAQERARAAVAVRNGYTPPVVTSDPTSTAMDAAFREHPGLTRVWHGARARGGDVPLFEALVETARQARAESHASATPIANVTPMW